MKQSHRFMKKEIRPLEMIRAMITEEINELEIKGLDKDIDGHHLIEELKECRHSVGSWINWIYDILL